MPFLHSRAKHKKPQTQHLTKKYAKMHKNLSRSHKCGAISKWEEDCVWVRKGKQRKTLFVRAGGPSVGWVGRCCCRKSINKAAAVALATRRRRTPRARWRRDARRPARLHTLKFIRRAFCWTYSPMLVEWLRLSRQIACWAEKSRANP